MAKVEKTIDELRAENEALKQQTAELTGKIDAIQAAGLSAAMEGVTPEIAKDVQWRVAQGLPLRHAAMAARGQAENDRRVLDEERANALKLQQGRELMVARQKLADLQAAHELETTNAKIASMESAKATAA